MTSKKLMNACQCVHLIVILIVMLTAHARRFISYVYVQLRSEKILIPVCTCIYMCIVKNINLALATPFLG